MVMKKKLFSENVCYVTLLSGHRMVIKRKDIYSSFTRGLFRLSSRAHTNDSLAKDSVAILPLLDGQRLVSLAVN